MIRRLKLAVDTEWYAGLCKWRSCAGSTVSYGGSRGNRLDDGMQLRRGVKVRVIVLAQQGRERCLLLQERRGRRVRLMAHNEVACFVFACC